MQLTVTKVLSSSTLFGYGGDFLPAPDQHHRTYQEELFHGFEANDWPMSGQGVKGRGLLDKVLFGLKPINRKGVF